MHPSYETVGIRHTRQYASVIRVSTHPSYETERIRHTRQFASVIHVAALDLRAVLACAQNACLQIVEAVLMLPTHTLAFCVRFTPFTSAAGAFRPKP